MELTFHFMWLISWLLKVNTAIVPATGVLSMVPKKGIITLTLVISRESARPTITRGFCVMNLKVFRVKTKIQVQSQEYITWKKERGVNVSENIDDFIKYAKKESIENITPQDIQSYYHHLKATVNAKFFILMALKDIRVMLRWFKARKYNVVEPDIIGDTGLTIDLEGDIIEDNMTVEKVKLGRPPKVALIKKVKSLRDINKLSFREISRVIKKDVSQVYVWYYYNLDKVS